jgi:hypothetical protein
MISLCEDDRHKVSIFRERTEIKLCNSVSSLIEDSWLFDYYLVRLTTTHFLIHDVFNENFHIVRIEYELFVFAT